MLLAIEPWLKELQQKLSTAFGNRILFTGLQGSYARGEAGPKSDIDFVLILDKAELSDLEIYRNIIRSMPFSEKACGFVSGKKEIQNWEKSDLFQFIHDTRPLSGNLAQLISPLSAQDIRLSIKNGAQNLYHAAVHSFLFDEPLPSALTALYKMVFFILQAEYFLLNNQYISSKKELFSLLDGDNKQILDYCLNREKFSGCSDAEIKSAYDKLIRWCSEKISS